MVATDPLPRRNPETVVFEARTWPKGTFLSRLSVPDRTRLLRLGVLHSLGPHRALVRQGDPAGSVWLLIDALVKVSARVENGTEALLALRVSGDMIGEMAVLGETVRSATVVTCGRAVVCQIRGEAFVGFLQRHPAAALILNQMTIERLRWSNQRRLDFAGYTAGQCLARVLLALAGRHGRPCDAGVDLGIPLTQAELGGLVGAKEDTVQKALRALTSDGLVSVAGRRRVVITDLARLTEFADLH
ncbi:Crp/Fnr family transcriptional regulator [Actinomadura madurae]|uniref:Crp/Fnr family transcriptional regulator n=1 Tax=Actinomadura madurae TaxID=1993 RepID=UPI00210EAB87|nr:Crp/Fnr family transcriptional regulator [Actinomadura madurae]